MKDKKHNRVFLGEKIDIITDDEDYLGKYMKNSREKIVGCEKKDIYAENTEIQDGLKQ